MTDPRAKKVLASPPWRRHISKSLLIVALLACFLYILFRILLTTQWASDYASQALTRYSQQKVTVAKFTMAGSTISLNGIVIESPPGFSNKKMLSARTVAVTPDIGGLLRGKRSLSKLEITGLGIVAEKNSSGDWNFSELLKRLTKKKEKPSGELFIRHFSVQDSSLQFNGYRLDKLGVTLADFSTKGTSSSKLVLSGKDAAGNLLHVTTQGQLGSNPAFHVVADAPAVSLAPLQKHLRGTAPLQLKKAHGKLTLTADLRNRLLTVRAAAAFKELVLTIPGGKLPLSGHLDLEARYNSLQDSAELVRSDLTIDNVITLRASGSMQQVSKDLPYTLKITPDRVDLGTLSALLPAENWRGVTLSGEMSSRGFQLTGNPTKGITAASGELALRSVTLKKSQQLILAGGAADFSLKKLAEDWQVTGKAFSEGRHDSALVKAISLPFSARFSPRFKPTDVAVPTFTAVLSGIPVTGSFQYRDTAAVPFTFGCSADKVPLTTMNGFMAQQPGATRMTSGTVTARAKLSGFSPRKFRGTVTLDLNSAAAESDKKKIFLKKGLILTTVQKDTGTYSVAGSLKVSGGTFAKKPFEAGAGFSLDTREAIIRNLVLGYGPSRFRANRINARIPKKNESTGQTALVATISGAELKSGDLAVSGMAARIDLQYSTVNQKQFLYGKSDLTIASLTFRNQALASGTIHLAANGSHAQADVKGLSLGGTLSGRVNAEIFSKARKISFTASLLKQQLELLGGLLPKKFAAHIATGTADAQLNGTYLHKSGVRGTLTVNGHDITLKNSTGKTLVSGIAASLNSTLDGRRLKVQKAILSQAQGPSLRIEGAVENFASAGRSGTLSLAMPSTPINSLLDAFANALPRNLQEASCEGNGTFAGSIELRGANTRISGNLALESATLEIPSQKISVAGIAGNIPFALEFPGKHTEPEHPQLRYSRANYTRLLKEQSGNPGTGERLSISSLRFGAFETGALSLFITAANGLTRFSPIEVKLYDGRLLGSGYLSLNGTPKYGVDILLNDISLKEFCNSFPAIKGYITGRVDGILSLKNEQSGLKELIGYVNLWTRSGRGEEMLVSKEFLQKLAGKKLRGFFFQNDRSYDNGEIIAYLQRNYLTFEKLDISHTNFLGMKDLSVSVAPIQNRIALDHLLASIRDAAARGKGNGQETAPIQTDLKWLE
ncbi:MAG: hypothetical protein EG822_13900 [Deltaproteobacteria bacterium]|nr:hypothetical protein [Deltaproteobacteria bacterium]TLN02779.1 MAG: hypothetical protein FDZ73_10490 [bacterium]